MNKAHIDHYADKTAEKIACGMIAHLLLKNGYTASSVAKAVHVPESFVKYMEQDGIKHGFFPGPSKVCNKVLENRLRMDRIDFLACHRRIIANETPPKEFCEIWGMSFKELVLAEKYISYWSAPGFDPLRLLIDELPERASTKRNPIEVFVKAKCEVGSNKHCDTKLMFDAWNKWRLSKGLKEINSPALGKRLKKLHPNLDTLRYRIEGGFSRKYIGIGLKNERN